MNASLHLDAKIVLDLHNFFSITFLCRDNRTMNVKTKVTKDLLYKAKSMMLIM